MSRTKHSHHRSVSVSPNGSCHCEEQDRAIRPTLSIVKFALPDEKDVFLRSRNQGLIIEKLAKLDPGKALALLTQLSPSVAEGSVKPKAYEKVVQSLLEAGKLDGAVDVLSAYGEGEYPFGALTAVMQELAQDDGRRVILFGLATSAYTATPRGDFGELIIRHWETLPRESVQAAVSTITSNLLNPPKRSGKSITRFSSNQGAVTFNSREELDLFKLLKVVKANDAKRLAEIFEKHPGMEEAMTKLPGGVSQGMTMNANSSGDDAASRMEGERMASEMAQRMDQVERVRLAAEKDPREALKLAEKIKDADMRLSALVTVGNAAAEKQDAALSATVLAACAAAMEKADEPIGIGMALIQMGDIAARAKQPDLVRQIAEKGFAAAELALKSDLKKDNPNTAPRDVWPSVQMARMLMLLTGRELGTDAALLLDRWKDPDLRLVAQIALARALLGEMPTEMNMSISRSKP